MNNNNKEPDKEPVVHKDVLGQVLEIDDYVVVPGTGPYKRMVLGQVRKLNPKMITVAAVTRRGTKTTIRTYSSESVKVSAETATMVLLSGEYYIDK